MIPQPLRGYHVFSWRQTWLKGTITPDCVRFFPYAILIALTSNSTAYFCLFGFHWKDSYAVLFQKWSLPEWHIRRVGNHFNEEVPKCKKREIKATEHRAPPISAVQSPPQPFREHCVCLLQLQCLHRPVSSWLKYQRNSGKGNNQHTSVGGINCQVGINIWVIKPNAYANLLYYLRQGAGEKKLFSV